MSSNIKVQRICQHCGKEFTAKTTVTQFCGDTCAKSAYKARGRKLKVEQSNIETQLIKTKPFEDLKSKEFLKVKEVAKLLNCSVRSVYYYIESGNIKAVNLGQRITRVKRSEIDRLFEQPRVDAIHEKNINPDQCDISECYKISEVQSKYGISETALQQLLKRYNIPKIKKGKFVYIAKKQINKHLNIS
ncbi:MAG: helix-turn-helix domain-containing protein [Saprospiraceae bacterium]